MDKKAAVTSTSTSSKTVQMASDASKGPASPVHASPLKHMKTGTDAAVHNAMADAKKTTAAVISGQPLPAMPRFGGQGQPTNYFPSPTYVQYCWSVPYDAMGNAVKPAGPEPKWQCTTSMNEAMEWSKAGYWVNLM